MSIFSYGFMQVALVVGILLAIIIPMLGVVIVMRHLSMMGDSLSHVTLAGVAAGLLLNVNPVLGAVIAAILGAFSIEAIRRKIPKYSEVAIAIVTAGGVGLAGVLSGFVKNAANFNSFLFGSIVAISNTEFIAVIIVAVVILVLFLVFWREFELMAFDEQLARLSGVPMSAMNFTLTMMIAVAVAIAARAVGALIVSAIMVVPVVSAMQLNKGYKLTVLFSILYAEAAMLIALVSAFYLNLKPGGTIVLVAIALLLLTFFVKWIKKKIHALIYKEPKTLPSPCKHE